MSYIAVSDVAEACVRLVLGDDPPAAIKLGGPERMTRLEVVDAFERTYGVPFRRIAVPRPVLAMGARVARRLNPGMASLMGMALSMDVDGCPVPADGIRELGIEPRPVADKLAVLRADPKSSA